MKKYVNLLHFTDGWWWYTQWWWWWWCTNITKQPTNNKTTKTKCGLKISATKQRRLSAIYQPAKQQQISVKTPQLKKKHLHECVRKDSTTHREKREKWDLSRVT